MSVLHALRARLRALFRRSSADSELGEEIRFHIELETEKSLRLGMPAAEARRLAVAHFGGVQRVREEHGDVRRQRWLADFAADARFTLCAVRGRGETQVLVESDVSGTFFSTFGVRAALGRTFVDDETWQRAARVALLSDRAWRDRFGADSGVIGTS